MNLYGYCGNEPVNGEDASGTRYIHSDCFPYFYDQTIANWENALPDSVLEGYIQSLDKEFGYQSYIDLGSGISIVGGLTAIVNAGSKGGYVGGAISIIGGIITSAATHSQMEVAWHKEYLQDMESYFYNVLWKGDKHKKVCSDAEFENRKETDDEMVKKFVYDPKQYLPIGVAPCGIPPGYQLRYDGSFGSGPDPANDGYHPNN
jgi:hypothetical protein